MSKTGSTVLVINSGSSSIKYQLIDPDSGKAISSGLVEKIGETSSHITHHYAENTVELRDPIADHGAGLAKVLQLFDDIGPDLKKYNVVAVGHRVVQGGSYFSGPALINQEVYDLIKQLCPLAPLHNPAHLKGIEVAMELLPDIPHVAVFDTAFFQNLPDEAATYALDKEICEKYNIRRYGAHGTSHQYVSQVAAAYLGRDDLKMVTCHLGNGASVAAVCCGRALDTSMGLTPLEGLVMGTRTGDIDPATVFHLVRNAGMSIDEIDELFNKKSGMKGLCGKNDMRSVRAKAASGSADADLALRVYNHRLLKYVGAYSAVMGGLDAIVFTAGVGENDPLLRAALVKRLRYMGAKLDPDANTLLGKETRVISTPDSAITLMVVPTNEELAIARQALALV